MKRSGSRYDPARDNPPFDGGGDIEEIPMATVITADDYFGQNEKSARKSSLATERSDFTSSSFSKSSGKTAPTSSPPRKPANAFTSSESSRFLTEPDHSSDTLKLWPPSIRAAVMNSFERPLLEASGKEFMTNHGWPIGLQAGLLRSCKKYPIRFFIVDDSGSMSTNDGRRVAGSGATSKVIQCTRWAELVAGLQFLTELSEALGAPSEIRLLNGADPVMVGLGDDNGEGLTFATEAFHESPGGQTPLCQHINAVVSSLTSVAPELKRLNKKAVVIICTDGEATDGDVAAAMRPLKQLPVWVVLRLCTNEKKVIKYWNDIDRELELELDVVDDMIAEATEVAQHNGWLTYGEPLQRYREFGAFLKELDLVDEQGLSGDQLKMVCGSLFLETSAATFPHPDVDWRAFITAAKAGNDREPLIFCTNTGKMSPWIKLDLVKKIYGGSQARSSTCSIS